MSPLEIIVAALLFLVVCWFALSLIVMVMAVFALVFDYAHRSPDDSPDPWNPWEGR